jgi:hypothetical protein
MSFHIRNKQSGVVTEHGVSSRTQAEGTRHAFDRETASMLEVIEIVDGATADDIFELTGEAERLLPQRQSRDPIQGFMDWAESGSGTAQNAKFVLVIVLVAVALVIIGRVLS